MHKYPNSFPPTEKNSNKILKFGKPFPRGEGVFLRVFFLEGGGYFQRTFSERGNFPRGIFVGGGELVSARRGRSPGGGIFHGEYFLGGIPRGTFSSGGYFLPGGFSGGKLWAFFLWVTFSGG